MRRLLLLTMAAALASCAGGTQVFSSTGVLHPGSQVTIRATGGEVNVYKPAVGQSSDQYTVSATASGPTPSPPTTAHTTPRGLDIASNDVNLLVRVPDRVRLDASSSRGDVNVTDISGPVVAHAADGNVKIMVPGYAQASTGTGDVTVFMGATTWPGTLHFSSDNGVVTLWINETAHFTMRLHVDNGAITTDFPVRGRSHGTSATIDASVGKDPKQTIDVRVRKGVIRVLQLKPQV